MHIRALQQFRAWKQHHSDGLKNEERYSCLKKGLKEK